MEKSEPYYTVSGNINWYSHYGEQYQFSSVAQSCPTLCDPMNHSTPGLPIRHQLSEFTQTHVHRVSDAIQPSHPLLSPSPPAPNPSQHQSLFQWVNSSHEVLRFLKKLKIELPYDPAIPLLGMYLEKIIIQKDTCTPVFIAALFTIAKTWKQPKCSLTEECIKKMWYCGTYVQWNISH